MRAAAIVAAALGLAALVWVGVTGGDAAPGPGGDTAREPAPTDREPANSDRADMAPSASAYRALPRLPDSTAAGADRALSDRPLFDEDAAERRDPAWASATEAAIRQRVDALLGGRDGTAVPSLECRETVCRLLVTSGDEAALRGFAADLNSERGFVGRAELLAFEDVERSATPDGAMRYALRVMLAYRR